MQRELISNALGKRFLELRSRIAQLAAEQFGDMHAFVSQLRNRVISALPADLKHSPLASMKQDVWLETETDCLTCLRRLSLGEQLGVSAGLLPQLAPFMESLIAARRRPELRVQLLTERYGCPVNFALPSEAEAREYLLTRLMVNDRRSIEENSIEVIDSDDVLLKLNLIALQAATANDLRFLDALNYYYELLPETWHPRARHDWLLITYYALYSQALAVWI